MEGDRVYVVTNRAEAVCLDINGLADGNDGPFKDEEKFMTQGDATPVKLGKLIAADAERIGPRIFHATWSSPSMGQAGGKRHVYFGRSVSLGGAFGVSHSAFLATGPRT